MMPAPKTKAQQVNPFDIMRRRVQQQTSAAGEQSQDMLRRQFASNGMAGSGANIKLQQQAQDQTQRAGADALSQVDQAEGQQQEAERQRAFAREERIGTQEFAKSEREGGQIFSKQLFDEDMNFKKQVESNADFWRSVDAAQSESANKMNFMLGMGNLDWHPADATNLYNQASQMFDGINSGKQLPVPARRAPMRSQWMEAMQRRLG
jgi:hypothetical protein